MTPMSSGAREAHPAEAGASRRVWRPWPITALALLLLAAGTGLASAAAFALALPPVAREAELVQLLRGMALLKAGLTLLAAAAVAWRLLHPAGTPPFARYFIAVWTMAFASALVWQGAWVGSAALAFHGAEFGFLFLAWRDDRDMRRARPTG